MCVCLCVFVFVFVFVGVMGEGMLKMCEVLSQPSCKSFDLSKFFLASKFSNV